MYVPGARSAETVDVPPELTISPFTSTPFPLIATLCGRDEGFAMLMITVPAAAASSLTSKRSAFPGSALISIAPAAVPPPPAAAPPAAAIVFWVAAISEAVTTVRKLVMFW